MVSVLVSGWVRALAERCVLMQDTLLSQCLPPASERDAGGNPAMDWHPIQGVVEITLVA